MRKRFIAKILVLVIFLTMSCFVTSGGENMVLAKSKSAVKKVKVGKQLFLGNHKKGAVYKSSDTRIASVNSKGMVTGKKAGTVKITQKVNKKKKSYTVKVIKNARKPATLPVTFDEVILQDEQIRVQSPEKTIYSAKIRNISSKGTIRKISYRFEINVKSPVSVSVPDDGKDDTATGGAINPAPSGEETKWELKKKTVTITAANIAAGKISNRLQCEGDYTGLLSNMKLIEINLYTGSARYRYRAAEGKYLFTWGTKDKKAPTITGLVKKKSYTGYKDPYQSVYTDKKKKWNPARFVSAVDDRDGKVRVKADTSRINWKKSGIYKVYFRAKDKAGNVAKSWAKVRVIVPGTAESIADKVLRSITKNSWSDKKKAKAIYQYVRKRCSYVHNAAHKDWRVTAVKGIRYQSGDCYTYYSVSRLLLTRAGIPNVMVKRYPTPRGMRHYWNLAYVRGGWYHFDTTPRIRTQSRTRNRSRTHNRAASFCLRTDAQMFAYSRGYTFRFKRRAYVKRATRKL